MHKGGTLQLQLQPSSILVRCISFLHYLCRGTDNIIHYFIWLVKREVDKLGFKHIRFAKCGELHSARDPSRRCFPSRHSWAKRRISRENILFEDDTGGEIKQTALRVANVLKSKFEKYYCITKTSLRIGKARFLCMWGKFLFFKIPPIILSWSLP